MLEPQEPRSLDPAILNNVGGSFHDVLGNALYGTLLQGDSVTSKWTPSMATDLSTTDSGKTWTMKLRSGIVYSDGSPMTAADVVFNWQHIADPKAGSASIQDANGFTATAADNLTINITPKAQNIHFPTVILESDLNWVAKPAALQAGQAAFDANPIGAGPFTLQSWKRSDVITLVKNPKYWDAPKPYLDGMQIRSLSDYNTRWSTMVSGAADFDDEGNWGNVVKAQKAGNFTVNSLDYGGGTGLGLNTTRAPFNDVRARKALADALDLNLIDQALYGTSTGQIPATFFAKNSPYYSSTPLQTQNQKEAQDLFDQYAAATGQPVTFTISFVSQTSQPVADSVITQLSAYKNVKVSSKVVDIANYGSIVTKRDFDAFTIALTPTRTGLNLGSTSAGNTTGLKDPAIDTAIGTLYTNPDATAIKGAWATIQKELADQVPYIFYARLSLTAITTKKVNGVTHYGFGSVPVDTIWMSP